MSSFEKELEAAIQAKDLPGAVLTASDLTGMSPDFCVPRGKLPFLNVSRKLICHSWNL